METLLLVIVGSLGVLFFWGLVSPRTQWRLLASWSYRDPYANEPSRYAYGLYRLVAAIGIASMLFSGVLVSQAHVDGLPPEPTEPTAAQRMWGSPLPRVLNRVVVSAGTIPSTLVDQPILGYQVVDGVRRQPPYLFGLRPFAQRNATPDNGLIGREPRPGLTALDSANLVVEVAGDPRCFPHEAVVVETSKVVQIGIFYGQENPEDGSNAQNLADCVTRASARNVKLLVPIRLNTALGTREVQTLAGDAIRKVPLID